MSKDIEALRARFATGRPAISGGTKHDRLIIKKGESPKIRILPGEFGANQMFFLEQSQHWLPGRDGKDMPYACLAQLEEPEDCKVCNWWQKFTKVNTDLITGSDAKEVEKKKKLFSATLRKLNVRRSFMMNVVLRGKTPGDDKVLIYGAPQTVFSQIYALIEKNLEEGIYLLDEEDGYDITITREDKDNQTTYSVQGVLKSKPIGKIGDKNWQDCAPNLDDVIREDIEKTRRYKANMIKAVDDLCAPVWKVFKQYAIDIDSVGELTAESTNQSGNDDDDDDIPMDYSGKSSRDLLDDDVPSFDDSDGDSITPATIDDDEDLAEMQRRAKAFLEEN